MVPTSSRQPFDQERSEPFSKKKKKERSVPKFVRTAPILPL